MARLIDTMSPFEMAKIIFEDFDLHQSCAITGWMEYKGDKQVLSKGDEVLRILTEMDMQQNCDLTRTDSRPRRKRKILENSVGGYVAHKIFMYKKVFLDSVPKVTIWRYQ